MAQQINNVDVDEAIILLVKERSFLYDKSSFSYKNIDKKNHAWEEIAAEVANLTGREIQSDKVINKWEYFKTKYMEQRKEIASYIPSGSAASENKEVTWKYYNSMMFLEKHVNHRKTENEEDNEEPITYKSQDYLLAIKQSWDKVPEENRKQCFLQLQQLMNKKISTYSNK
ncbi:uncharacterized protein LOC122506258 [Leptopilina heterotoma]|uniref:uncharacterized protein LOC122506258 n=1 Tax=Leptopilina heterotoma TaxID=63436 RepID=UPI001CA83E71|nr:uncharacterized protein LOC122506258 [Leptopilina heterotoma]